jgi:polysaccharide biosynthesis transport protein
MPLPEPGPHAITEASTADTGFETPQVDLRGYLRMLWRSRWIILACIIICPLGAYLLTSRLDKVYVSSTTIAIGPSIDASITGQPVTQDPNSIAILAQLIPTPVITKGAAQRLPDHKLVGTVAARANATTGFITIRTTSDDPLRAAQIANAVGEEVIAERKKQGSQRINDSIIRLQKQLALVKKTDLLQRRQLSEQLQQFRAVQASQGAGNSQVVLPAAPNNEPVSPHPVRNGIIGLIIGLLLGIALAFLRDRLDRRVRQPTELESIVDAPLLSVVPETAFENNPEDHSVREAFQTLRTSLTYFNVDRPLRTVVVTSASKEDGKTTVSTNLALALARADRNVVLVDADMRRPQVAKRLNLQAITGLAEVLVGQSTLDESLLQHETDGAPLTVLPCGTPPPNPSELIASERMRSLLAELTERFDMVIIDSTPLLAVSDALPLVREASGTVLVGRMNRTQRDAFSRVRKMIVAAHGTVLGVVATGQEAAYLYGYGEYGSYGYESSNGDGAGAGGGGRRFPFGRKRAGANGVTAEGEHVEEAPTENGAENGAATPPTDGDEAATETDPASESPRASS